MPKSFVDFFEARGYRVLIVGQRLPAGSPDVSVVAAALAEGAVAVTTDAHFRRLKEVTEGTGGRLQRADRIYFKKCPNRAALARVEELIDTIENEYRLAKEKGRKFFIQITSESYTVFR